jgi:hyperosmotically inducible periplasmic protein
MFCVSFLLPDAAAQRNTGGYDEQILQDSNKLLPSQKEYQGVRAATEDQIVTLEGNVNLYIDLVNLEKKVKKVKNVDGVRNHVQVQSNVGDDQSREKLADKLRYDRVGFGIAFNALTLDLKDGMVARGGNVRDYPARDSAVAIAETTPGVNDLMDNIEVAATSTFDDDLRMKLYRAIHGFVAALRTGPAETNAYRRRERQGHALRSGRQREWTSRLPASRPWRARRIQRG